MADIGLIKWFDADKGFGVIINSAKEEFFLHEKHLNNITHHLEIGTAIIFDSRRSKTKNRNEAINCRFVTSIDDLKLVFKSLAEVDLVSIEITTRNRYYGTKSFKKFSITEMSLKSFFQNHEEMIIIEGIKAYFDNYLDNNFFISFYEHIEKSLLDYFEDTQSKQILKTLQQHFADNLDEVLLFNIWIHEKFVAIAYTAEDDFEIPQEILLKNKDGLTNNDLKRIYKFSYGPNLCKTIVSERFKALDSNEVIDYKELKGYLSYLSVEDNTKYGKILYSIYKEKIFSEYEAKLQTFKSLESHSDYAEYESLSKNIPTNLSQEDSVQLEALIKSYLVKNCSNNYAIEIWIKGIIDKIDVDQILSIFIDRNTPKGRKCTILSKLAIDDQFKLLKNTLLTNGYKETYSILEDFLRNENQLGYYFKLVDHLFDNEFWNEKIGAQLLFKLNDFLENSSSDNKKFNLFLEDYIKHPPEHIIYKSINQLDQLNFRKIIYYYKNDNNKIKEFLLLKATFSLAQELIWLYDIALKVLLEADFLEFDTQVSKIIDSGLYLDLWEARKGRVILYDIIAEGLNDKYNDYLRLNKWLDLGIISFHDVFNILGAYLKRQEAITDKTIFYKHFYHIKFLVSKGEKHLIEEINNHFYITLLWVQNESENFYFDLLKDKFIYFSNEDQVVIIKKLFYSKAIGKFDLTLELLEELTRFDINLYNLNKVYHPDFSIDLSTDLVIKSLVSLKNHQRFPNEMELLINVLSTLTNNKLKVKIEKYFEPCLGRMTADFNWSTEGTIRKVFFGNSKFYYAIDFPTGETQVTNGYYGPREVFVKNSNFDYLLSQVKKLPGAKWNPNENHWGVAFIYEKEVLDFASRNQFFIDEVGSNYVNNKHLASFSRFDKHNENNANIPNGVLFCEGRLAINKHQIFDKGFYWCKGEACFERCNPIHSSNEWSKYTLLDFCKILDINVDSFDSVKQIVEYGRYYEYTSFINRFNRLLEKLYCKECQEILHPFNTSNFAAHTVVRFCCENHECSSQGKDVYLNHCLNGKCNNVIDSRVSKKCANGLHICDECGSCCSHAMMTRRFENLVTTGGYIHNNLRYAVSEKLGHLERAEYYCYKCGKLMEEFPNENYKCLSCAVEYKTEQYKIKRPHRHLRKQS